MSFFIKLNQFNPKTIMSTVHRYVIFGPETALAQMPGKVLDAVKPKFSYEYNSQTTGDIVVVSVYEEYERSSNSTVTLTTVIEKNSKFVRVQLKKAGGRIGFRGSSIREEQNIESGFLEFVMDFADRHGCSMQKDTSADEPEE